MCFSTEASFGAGIVLSVIGAASLKKVRESSETAFAAVPLIFAGQQITEGFLWLALSNKSFAFLELPCTYIFLIIAQIIWPVWVPFSVLKIEKTEKRKLLIKIFLAMGIAVALYNAYCFTTYSLSANISGKHISYVQSYNTLFSNYVGIFYVLATTITPFFSSYKRMWSLSASIFISYLITTIFYKEYFVSVWCFFAAVISIAVYTIMNEISKSVSQKVQTQSS